MCLSTCQSHADKMVSVDVTSEAGRVSRGVLVGTNKLAMSFKK